MLYSRRYNIIGHNRLCQQVQEIQDDCIYLSLIKIMNLLMYNVLCTLQYTLFSRLLQLPPTHRRHGSSHLLQTLALACTCTIYTMSYCTYMEVITLILCEGIFVLDLFKSLLEKKTKLSNYLFVSDTGTLVSVFPCSNMR